MKSKIMALVMTVMMSLGLCTTALAADNAGVIGFVNMQVVLNSVPGIRDIAQQIANKRVSLQNDFNEQAKNLDDKGKVELQNKLNQELGKYENIKMTPVQKNINKAILKAAKDNGINSVVNSNTMLAGGKDLTNEVVAELKK